MTSLAFILNLDTDFQGKCNFTKFLLFITNQLRPGDKAVRDYGQQFRTKRNAGSQQYSFTSPNKIRRQTSNDAFGIISSAFNSHHSCSF